MRHGRLRLRPLARACRIISALLLLASLALGATARRIPGQDPSAPGSRAPSSSGPRAVPGYRQADRVAILTVHGEIDGVTLRSLERRVAEAGEEDFDAIVIELDTPGGAVDAARDIAHLLKNDAPVNTVAWINPTAFSAGTMIALACREIVVHPDATWGAAAPIMIDPTTGGLVPLPEAERAKIEAPIRADLVDDARRHHFDEKLVQAFVSVGLELWMLENTDTGERVFVDRIEYERVFGEQPPTEIPPVSPPQTGQFRAPPRPLFHPFDETLANEFEGLSEEEREERIQQRIAEAQSRPASRDPLTAQDRDQWRLVGQVVSNDELLVVKAAESIDYGLATAIVRNDEELAEYFGTAIWSLDGQTLNVVRMNESWSEKLVRALVSFWARAALILIFVISLLIEMAAPGTGLFGALAVVALLILIGAPYLAGMAQWWEILLIVCGLGLIAVELFVLPGLGIAGIAGVLCLLIGIVGTFVSGDVTTVRGQDQLLTGIGAVLIGLFAAAIGLWILSRHVYEIPFLRRFILMATTDAASGSDEPGPGLLGAMAAAPSAPQTGDIGIARTDLRPAGRAAFGERLFDVVTAGGYVRAGSRVRIVSVGSFRLEVEPVED